jgi:hypothetical protein
MLLHDSLRGAGAPDLDDDHVVAFPRGPVFGPPAISFRTASCLVDVSHVATFVPRLFPDFAQLRYADERT